MIPWLRPDTPFPPVETAQVEPNGLLAVGGDLSPARLLAAYRRGIFPWFNPGEPILWWSPDPRMVLFPAEFKCARSLAKTLRRGAYEVRVDSAFTRVMQACAAPRRGQRGTWINAEMVRAYTALHEAGHAHSFETWMDGESGPELVGGLYGVALGQAFFGESMFSRRTDASKIAFAHLVGELQARGFGVIDCQMSTPHLASLGAREIPRAAFTALLERFTAVEAPVGKWQPRFPGYGA
ncbi:MAG: leucyl/phenylalanyl-tRNA--protein transferase [Pseudomonadota bacterium]